MARYFYAWTPLVIVGTVVFLALPWLGLIALMIVAIVVLPALAGAVVYVPYTLGRAISRSWHTGESETPHTAPTLSPQAQA